MAKQYRHLERNVYLGQKIPYFLVFGINIISEILIT